MNNDPAPTHPPAPPAVALAKAGHPLSPPPPSDPSFTLPRLAAPTCRAEAERMREPNEGGSDAPHAPTSPSRVGKIARLPHHIREQLNLRLQDGELGQPLLDWLNSLPEVRAVLDSHFDGQPISHTNLTRWRQGGYRDWLVSHSALDLVVGLNDRLSLDQPELAGAFATRLAHCAALHYASCAQNLLSPDTKPADTLQFLRQLSADISRLHRPELHAQRLELERQQLEIERQRLALDQENSRKKTDAEFWLWTKRPDVQEKLHPKSQGGFTDETRQQIEEEFHLFPANRRKYTRKKSDTPAQFARKSK